MGFCAVDGLLMGTRSGSLDPGVVLYLMAQRGISAEEIEQLDQGLPALEPLHHEEVVPGVRLEPHLDREAHALIDEAALLVVEVDMPAIVRLSQHLEQQEFVAALNLLAQLCAADRGVGGQRLFRK